MAEDRLRELERRWEESASEQDELAYLQEQVRTGGALDWESYSRLAELNVEAAADYLRARVDRGDLERDKLELAAYCSHEPARLVLGNGAPEVPESDMGWGRGLRRWQGEVLVRTAVAISQAVTPATQAAEIARALSAAEEWLSCQCPEHARAARRAYKGVGGFDTVPEDSVRFCAGVAAELAAMVGQVDLLPMASILITKCFAVIERAGVAIQPVREGARRALLSWSLGSSERRY